MLKTYHFRFLRQSYEVLLYKGQNLNHQENDYYFMVSVLILSKDRYTDTALPILALKYP